MVLTEGSRPGSPFLLSALIAATIACGRCCLGLDLPGLTPERIHHSALPPRPNAVLAGLPPTGSQTGDASLIPDRCVDRVRALSFRPVCRCRRMRRPYRC